MTDLFETVIRPRKIFAFLSMSTLENLGGHLRLSALLETCFQKRWRRTVEELYFFISSIFRKNYSPEAPGKSAIKQRSAITSRAVTTRSAKSEGQKKRSCPFSAVNTLSQQFRAAWSGLQVFSVNRKLEHAREVHPSATYS